MIVSIDTSIVVAAAVVGERYHTECNALLDRPGLHIYSHGLAETFSTLSGGRRSIRLSAALTAELIETDYIPSFTVISLTPKEVLAAMRDAESRGVRGGAIFDYLHLVAARKAKASSFYTLNFSNFQAFHRPGDPQIVHP